MDALSTKIVALGAAHRAQPVEIEGIKADDLDILLFVHSMGYVIARSWLIDKHLI